MTTTTVNIHYAKTHLSRLIEQVAAGESVVIANAGRPVAQAIQQRVSFTLGTEDVQPIISCVEAAEWAKPGPPVQA